MMPIPSILGLFDRRKVRLLNGFAMQGCLPENSGIITIVHKPASNSKITMLQVGFPDELLRRSTPYRAAALDNVMPVTDAGEISDVLVDHEDRLPARLQHGQAVPDFLADQRRQTLGRLVEDQQSGIGHQRTADREHLL